MNIKNLLLFSNFKIVCTAINMIKNKILILIPLILLLPILILPLSSDHIIFILGGKTIAEGGNLYSDFIDIKQPIIFYFFSFLYSICRFDELYYRIFDYIWQSATVLSLIFVVGKIYRKQAITMISAILYTILYAVLNYSQTLQIETLVNLPLIWAIYLFHKTKSNYSLIISGLLLGIISGFKITLIINFFGIILIIILFKRNESFKIIKLTFSFIIGLILTNLPLLFDEVFSNYLLILKYLNSYSKFSPSGLSLIMFLLKNTAKFLGDFISLFIVFSLIYGIIVHIISPWKNRYKNEFSLLLIILMSLNFLMVLVEGKLAPYHFSRLLIYISIIPAIGINSLSFTIKFNIQKKNKSQKLILLLLILFLISFSPLTRYLNLYRPVYYYFTDKNKYIDFFTYKDDPVVNMRYHITVGSFIKSKSNPHEKVIISAIGSNQIYLYTSLHKFSIFGQSQFYISQGVPQKWKIKFINELNQTDWLITQTNDIHPSLTFHNKSTYELLMKNPQYKKIIEKEFELVKEIGAYKIFHKNKSK